MTHGADDEIILLLWIVVVVDMPLQILLENIVAQLAIFAQVILSSFAPQGFSVPQPIYSLRAPQ